MKRLGLGLGLSVCVLLMSGCTSADDKYIGEYHLGKGMLTLSTDNKCSYNGPACKWSAEKKEIILNTGKKNITLNIVSIENDILTISNLDKGGTKDKLFKKGGMHWNSIIGNYKCPGFWKHINLNNDGSFEGGVANGKWTINNENSIKLYPNRGNKVKWEYSDNQLFFDGESICQK